MPALWQASVNTNGFTRAMVFTVSQQSNRYMARLKAHAKHPPSGNRQMRATAPASDDDPDSTETAPKSAATTAPELAPMPRYRDAGAACPRTGESPPRLRQLY